MIIHAVFGSSCVPSAPRSRLIGPTTSREPTTPPATRSEWPPTYLVSEYMHEIRAVRERTLEHRAEKGIVHQHRRAAARLARADLLRNLAHQLEIDQTVGRIRRRLDHHQTDPAAGSRGPCGGARGRLRHRRPVVALREAHGAHAERRQGLVDQRLGAAVQRLAHQNHIAGTHIGPERRRNRRHAAREHRGGLALLPQRQAILEHLEIRIVESRIDEAARLAGLRLAAAGGVVEKILAVLRVLKTKVEVRKIGGLSEPSDNEGS